jgi:hypothetical protein
VSAGEINDEFGRLVSGAQVEDAAETTLQTWLPTYLAEMERQLGVESGSMPVPRAWERTNTWNQHLATQTPVIVLVSGGLAGKPELRNGSYRAAWSLGLAAVVRDKDQRSANTLAKAYGAAIRGSLVQHGSLGGFASSVDYLDEVYTNDPPDYLDIGASVLLDFDVWVDDITDWPGGPTAPIVPPEVPGGWPTVETTHIDIERRSLT